MRCHGSSRSSCRPGRPTGCGGRLGDAAPPPEAPLVLVGREGSRRVVLAADAAALRAGLRVGMPVAKAQALVPGLVDPGRRSRRRMPKRSSGWRSGCCSATRRSWRPIRRTALSSMSTGADHLHGGEEAMLDATGRAARPCPASPPARPSPTAWGAAHALARYAARPTCRRAARPRRLGAGRPADRRAAAARRRSSSDLRVLGFERIGDLLAQPRAPLALRFGPELGRRLDQALGALAEPIEPVRPPELVEVRRAFAEPIGAAETHRPLHRQAGRPSSAPMLEAQGSRRPAARSAVPPRRQPDRGDPRRHGAGRCATPSA